MTLQGPWMPAVTILLSGFIALGAVGSVLDGPGPMIDRSGVPGTPAAVAGAGQFLANLVRSPLGEVVIEEEHAALPLSGLWVRDEGPANAQALLAACPADRDREGCIARSLALVQESRGPEAAFALLEQAAAMDPGVDSQSHPLAHDLGRHALLLYGEVRETMSQCSYRVFAGCFHGALQAHFEGMPEVTEAHLDGLCPSDNPFREYTCLHGAGHGLFLATGHELQRSLALCDALPTDFSRGSCHGGVYMENIVGYFDSLRGAHHHHGPAGRVPLPYAVDASRPTYPCDAVPAHVQSACWLMQTSLILHFNGGDFAAASAVCAGLPAWSETCFRSLGRDAAPYTGRDPGRMVQHCSHAPPVGRAACVQGFTAETVLNYASPEAGLALCRALPEGDKTPCYREVGWQSRGMVDPATLAALCDTAETPAYARDCRSLATTGNA